MYVERRIMNNQKKEKLTVQTTMRFPESIKALLRRASKATGMSEGYLAREAIKKVYGSRY